MAKVASPESLGAEVKVVVTYVNNDGYFFVQLDTEEAYSISILSDKIATIVDSNRPTYSPDLGSQCFALSMADDSWYRAVVLENNELNQKATVYFVDYGNVESDLPLTRLAPATNDIFRLPYQAVKCQLAGFVPFEENWTPEMVDKLRQFIFNQEFLVVFHSLVYSPPTPILDNPCYSVSLFWEKGSDTVAAELIVKGFGQPSLVAETVTLSTATVTNAFCCYVSSPDSIWVQLASKQQVLEEITSVLNSGETSMTSLGPECLYPGVVCCTQFVDDQQFYRSTILSHPESDGKVSVLFSDYGNTATILIQDAFALPSSLLHYPALAVECTISGIKSVEQPGSWTDQVVKELAALIQDQELQVIFLSQEPGCCYYINAKLADGNDVSDILVQAGHANRGIDENVQVDTNGPSLEPYQPQTLQVGQQYTVYVTLAESPAVVWCQLAESTDSVSEVTQRLADKAGSFFLLTNASVNQVCCIQYSQDQAWYRGVVQMIDEEVAEVLFVDYGNTEEVPVASLHVLPQDLYFCPPLAVSFSLYGVEPIDGQWNDAAIKRFEELCFNVELTCNVVGLDDDGYSAVQLVVAATSQDIGSVLVDEGYALSTICEQPTPTVKEKSSLSAILSQILPAYPPLSIPTGTKIAVSVTDIVSLEQFSCQLLSTSNDLTLLMENIKEHCSSSGAKQVSFVHPGMSVIAPYSFDKSWYRAVMLRPDHIGQWSVQFVDYGNQETVLLDNLIEIEPEFLTLPPQAFVCTLSGFKEKLSDDDSAIEHFSDLVLEKEVECVVRKKRQDGIYVVELFSDGRSVNDLVGMALEEATPKITASPQKTSSQPGQLLSPQHSSSLHQQSSPQTAVSLSTPPMPTRPLSERIKKLINLQLPMLKVPVNRSISVCVCFLESPSYFSCQLVDQYQALYDLVLEMSNFYSNQSPQHASSIVASPGTFCAAIFSQDEQWYRAVVIGKHPRLDFADVLFIDYGNSDVVPLSSLRKLESQFKTLSCQSICCRLVDSDSQDLVLDKLVTVEFLEEPTSIAKPVPCRLRDSEIEGSIAKVASLSLEESSSGQHITSKSSPRKPVTPKTSPKTQSSDYIRVDSFQPTLNTPSLATVSYIISPHEIYCQPLVTSQELTDLMGVLFMYYVEQAKGSCLSGTDITGSYCAVPYADGSYYRGKVLSVIDDCAQVFYIDYGNTDSVPLADVSVLDRQFASLPAQAIKCSLSCITPSTPSWSTESIAVLMDTALNQEMNVTYLSKEEDGSYEVKMLGADDLDFSDLLIMSGMGVKSELSKPSSLSVSPTLLIPGIQEEVVLTAILPDCNLYCQLLSSEEALSILSDGIIDLISTSQSFSYAPDTFTTGMFVLAQFTEDDCWYRSRITSISQDVVQVIFIDYGNTETLPFSRLSSISPELCQLPAQAILCKLNKLENYAAAESTSQNMSDVLLNSALTLKCHQVDEHGVHTVDLTSESFGSVLQHIVDSGFVVSKNQVTKCTETHCEPSGGVQSTVEHAKTYFGPQCIDLSHIIIEPSSNFGATFSFFETPIVFFCQQTASSAALEDLQTSLNEHYSSTSSSCCTSMSDLKTDQLVATKFSEDGCWYRGEIQSIDLSNLAAYVLFVDYGNSEWTSPENICQLDAKFTDLLVQGIHCALESVQPNGSEWSSEAIDAIYNLCMAQTKVTIVAGETISGVLGVREIFNEQGESILQQFVATGLAKWKDTLSTPQSDAPTVSTTTTTTATILSTQKYPPVTISSGDSELVYISYSEPDGTIWVRLESRGPDLVEINSRISTVYSSDQKSFPFTPIVGAPCCALFADDGQWCRSKVMSVSDQDVQVLFVDYGNSETISPDFISSLKPEFCSVSPFAIHCQLSTSSPPLPPNAIEELFMLEFVNPAADDESMWEVVVSLEGGSSNQGIPQPSSTVTVIPELSLCQGQTHSVFISVAESPDQFWCQLTSQYDTLEALMATVGDFYTYNNPPVTVLPGMFCVSQFSDNSAWYRAKIVQVQSSDQVEVLYVDYGNRQVVQSAEEICGLDRRFAGIPSQAFCCSLLSSPQAEYADDKLEAFFSLNFDEDTFHLTLEKFLPSGRWLVSLTDKTGKSINDLFAPSSADTSSVLSSSSIPVSSSELSLSYPDLYYCIGATVDVFVTCVMSPSSFYCQPLHLSTDLDQLMEDLANYMATTKEEELQQQDVSVGQTCLARFSVDKNWYRARIDDFDEESGKFLAKFIDYGNSEYLESVDVALIPEQFVSTPCQVLHCSVVEEIDHNTSWSDDKKDAFKLSVCEEEQYTLKIVSFSPSKHKYVVEVLCDGELLDISFIGEIKTTSAPPKKPAFKEGRNSLDLSDVQTSFSGPDLSINSVTAIKGSKTPTTDPEESEGESIATGEPLIHAPFKLSLSSGEVVEVEVVYVQNPSYICVQRLDCSAALEGLSAEIDQYCDYADKLTQHSYHAGDFVLAQFSDDSVWYRAQVKSISDDDLYEVQFIDFGNSDFLPPTKLIMCPGNFLDLPVQAIPCSLAQVPNREVWPDVYKQIIDDLVQNKVMKVTVMVSGSHGMPATVVMEDSESGVQVSQKILEQLQDECEDGNLSFDFPSSTELHVPPETNELEEIAEEEEDTLLDEDESEEKEQYHTVLEATVESLVQRVRTLSMEELEAENLQMADLQDSASNTKLESFPTLTIGAKVKVRVLACNSLDEFVCQLLDSSSMEAITQAIQEENHNLENQELLNANLPVLAWHEEDKSWYRGLIADVSEPMDTVTIILVDLGVSKTLPVTEIHHISAKIVQTAPPQCFTCQLSPLLEADLDPVLAGADEELEWPSHCQEYFQEHIKEKDSFLAEIIQKKENVFVVQLFIVDSGEVLGSVRDNVIAKMAQSQDSLDCLNLETTKEDEEEEEEEDALQEQGTVEVQRLGNNEIELNDCEKVKGQDSSSKSFSTLQLLAGQEIKLTICSPFISDEFVCQPTEDIDSLDAMMKELKEHMSLPTDIALTDFKIDQPVVVHKEEDEKWYRAQVQKINTDHSEVQVILVDYGTIETLAASHVSTIPDHFLSLPKQAVTCLLTEEQEQSISVLEELKSDKRVLAKVLSITHSKEATVVLSIDDDRNVSAKLTV